METKHHHEIAILSFYRFQSEISLIVTFLYMLVSIYNKPVAKGKGNQTIVGKPPPNHMQLSHMP